MASPSHPPSPRPPHTSITTSQLWTTLHLHHVLPALDHTTSPSSPPTPGPPRISIASSQPWTTQHLIMSSQPRTTPHLHHILPAPDHTASPSHPPSPGDMPVSVQDLLLASLVAQMFKNLSAMQETRVRSLGAGYGNPLQYSCLEKLHGSHLACAQRQLNTLIESSPSTEEVRLLHQSLLLGLPSFFCIP